MSPLTMLPLVPAIAILGLVGYYPLGEYLADEAPSVALMINANNPLALRKAAEEIIKGLDAKRQASLPSDTENGDDKSSDTASRFAAPRELAGTRAGVVPPSTETMAAEPQDEQTKEALGRARSMLERSLRVDPLNYEALSLLAKVVEMQAGPLAGIAAARPYYELASQMSPRANDAMFWLMLRNLEEQKYEAVVAQADVLLRTTTRANNAVIPLLTALAEKPETTGKVQAMLATNPPWRDDFFAGMYKSVTDARTPLSLFNALKDSAHPPVQEELAGYYTFLMQRGFYELAYYTWLQFVPPEELRNVGMLFNGAFTNRPSGAPFDWSITSGAGSLVEFVPHPDRPARRALRVEFSLGRVQFGGISQFVVLSPGRYELTGERKGELEGRRGLRWRTYCVGTSERKLLGETPMHLTAQTQWQEFGLEFNVPDDCKLQLVRLELDARSSSEQLVRGTMWYSGMRLRRHASGETAKTDE